MLKNLKSYFTVLETMAELDKVAPAREIAGATQDRDLSAVSAAQRIRVLREGAGVNIETWKECRFYQYRLVDNLETAKSKLNNYLVREDNPRKIAGYQRR